MGAVLSFTHGSSDAGNPCRSTSERPQSPSSVSSAAPYICGVSARTPPASSDKAVPLGYYRVGGSDTPRFVFGRRRAATRAGVSGISPCRPGRRRHRPVFSWRAGAEPGPPGASPVPLRFSSATAARSSSSLLLHRRETSGALAEPSLLSAASLVARSGAMLLLRAVRGTIPWSERRATLEGRGCGHVCRSYRGGSSISCVSRALFGGDCRTPSSRPASSGRAGAGPGPPCTSPAPSRCSQELLAALASGA